MTKNILYVLPVKGGSGGAHSVAQEVDELIRFGVNVRIAVNAKNAPSFTTNYADLPNLARAIVSYDDVDALAALMSGQDLVIATIFTSVTTVAEACERVTGAKPRLGYYIQDYEPLFCDPDEPLRQQAIDSYTRLPGALLFAKTDWIRDIVTRNHGVPVHKVSPSLDTSLYYPTLREQRDSLWVSVMIRPPTPRRAPRRTMGVLKELADTYGDRITINLFGCSDEEIVAHQLPSDFAYTNHGRLQRQQVASLFRASDVVMDLSDYQAFGRPGLEAMACGCATFLPVFGGTHEYGIDGVNTMLVDTRCKASIVRRFEQFMALSDSGRRALRNEAVRTSQRYSIARAAWSELDVFERYLAA